VPKRAIAPNRHVPSKYDTGPSSCRHRNPLRRVRRQGAGKCLSLSPNERRRLYIYINTVDTRSSLPSRFRRPPIRASRCGDYWPGRSSKTRPPDVQRGQRNRTTDQLPAHRRENERISIRFATLGKCPTRLFVHYASRETTKLNISLRWNVTSFLLLRKFFYRENSPVLPCVSNVIVSRSTRVLRAKQREYIVKRPGPYD